MKKKLNEKLVLTKETLRTLSGNDMADVLGGAASRFCTTGTSGVTDTCETCVGPECR
ncbi:MAG TPA: class I lanthipeptide [Thermoanaerobaculia bacterium]|nr:class I lanthipeptide [Thermoanaerobaculia bacterium]